MPLNTAWELTKQTFSEYSEDRIPRLSAALAYYAIFAIAPLLVIAIAIAGFIFGERAASGELGAQLTSVVGPDLAKTIQSFVGAARPGAGGILATIISVILLLVGATSLFGELQDSLNTIWEVRPKSSGAWGLLRTRFLSFLMVLGIGALLIASLVLSAVLTGMTAIVGTGLGYQVANQIGSLIIFTLLFALIFKFLPDVEIRWQDVWLGAAITAVLFAIGRYLIGLYLARGSVGSIFGAAGSLVALLVWVYYSAQILFIGAEFTQVYAHRYGQGIHPADYAERTPGAVGTQAEGQAPAPAAPAAAHGPVRAYPVSYPLPEPAQPRDGRQPSTGRKVLPLAIGLAIGRFLLPAKKAQPKAPPKAAPPKTRRSFAPARVLQPGWRSRAENVS